MSDKIRLAGYTDRKGRQWIINVIKDSKLIEEGLENWTEIRALTTAENHLQRHRYHAAFVPSSDPDETEMWEIIHRDMDAQEEPIPLKSLGIATYD